MNPTTPRRVSQDASTFYHSPVLFTSSIARTRAQSDHAMSFDHKYGALPDLVRTFLPLALPSSVPATARMHRDTTRHSTDRGMAARARTRRPRPTRPTCRSHLLPQPPHRSRRPAPPRPRPLTKTPTTTTITPAPPLPTPPHPSNAPACAPQLRARASAPRASIPRTLISRIASAAMGRGSGRIACLSGGGGGGRSYPARG